MPGTEQKNPPFWKTDLLLRSHVDFFQQEDGAKKHQRTLTYIQFTAGYLKKEHTYKEIKQLLAEHFSADSINEDLLQAIQKPKQKVFQFCPSAHQLYLHQNIVLTEQWMRDYVVLTALPLIISNSTVKKSQQIDRIKKTLPRFSKLKNMLVAMPTTTLQIATLEKTIKNNQNEQCAELFNYFVGVFISVGFFFLGDIVGYIGGTNEAKELYQLWSPRFKILAVISFIIMMSSPYRRRKEFALNIEKAMQQKLALPDLPNALSALKEETRLALLAAATDETNVMLLKKEGSSPLHHRDVAQAPIKNEQKTASSSSFKLQPNGT